MATIGYWSRRAILEPESQRSMCYSRRLTCINEVFQLVTVSHQTLSHNIFQLKCLKTLHATRFTCMHLSILFTLSVLSSAYGGAIGPVGDVHLTNQKVCVTL